MSFGERFRGIFKLDVHGREVMPAIQVDTSRPEVSPVQKTKDRLGRETMRVITPEQIAAAEAKAKALAEEASKENPAA